MTLRLSRMFQNRGNYRGCPEQSGYTIGIKAGKRPAAWKRFVMKINRYLASERY